MRIGPSLRVPFDALNILRINSSLMNAPSPGKRKTREERWDEADEAALEGDLSAQQGEYEKALLAYERALAICPSNPDLWAFTAITLESGLHLDDPARAAWKRAQELDPAIRDAFSDQPEEVQSMVQKKMVGGCRSTLRHLAEDDTPDSS
jgi:tetratricopeptide (TPR) repeat protein